MNAIPKFSEQCGAVFPEYHECNCGLKAHQNTLSYGTNNVLIWVCSQGHPTRVTYCSSEVINAIQAKFNHQEMAA